MSDIYVLATQIQDLFGQDQYKDPPAHGGRNQVIVRMVREYVESQLQAADELVKACSNRLSHVHSQLAVRCETCDLIDALAAYEKARGR